jgi:hypothetical protein
MRARDEEVARATHARRQTAARRRPAITRALGVHALLLAWNEMHYGSVIV